ncbi:Histidine acid phosphatase, partial [Trichostrongylus colubriformis]
QYQLSPIFFKKFQIGMKQHMNLGKLIRKTYIDAINFLSRRYSSKEIYVRSTDLNRTIISAMANILGMYGPENNLAVPDIDYPDDDGWPAGFVPVAVHTVQYATDYVLNPDTNCSRHMHLWKMAKGSSEVQTFINRPDVADLFANLTTYCGWPVDIDNLWIIRDALLVEQIHANDTLRAVNSWFDDEIFEKMTAINDQVLIFQNGIFSDYGTVLNYVLLVSPDLKTVTYGIHSITLILGTLSARAASPPSPAVWGARRYQQLIRLPINDCKWINGLKYYVYSAVRFLLNWVNNEDTAQKLDPFHRV